MTGKFFEATEKAKMAVSILPEEMIYPDTTAKWERELEAVATGRENYEEFYQSQLQGLTVLLDKAREAKIKPSENSVLCPTCGKVMVRRKGKNGYFWSCVAYPECRTTARDNNGKADFTKMVRKPA